MNMIRYQHPELSRLAGSDRLSPLRDLLDSAFQLAGGAEAPRSWVPPIELHEDKDHYSVELELPGMKKEDFHLSLEEGVLHISGERKQEREIKEGEIFRSERVYGSFERSLAFPIAVKPDAVTASYKDGILRIVLPKAEEAKPKKIEVALN
jgi:HSP20 family protein